jgi:large subunit ribosomal protein L4
VAAVKKYNLEGKETGEVDVGDLFDDLEAHPQMLKDYIVALRENKRQWSACTKNKSEVAHSGKKPHKQKGTGKARQGSLASPQYKGGGVVFGPRPKFDQHVRINQKERRKAIAYLLGEKIQGGKLTVIEDSRFEEPKTARLAKFFKQRGIGGRVLLVAEGVYIETETDGVTTRVSAAADQHRPLRKSLRNIPKSTFRLAPNVNGYDLMVASDVVISESALGEILSEQKR